MHGRCFQHFLEVSQIFRERVWSLNSLHGEFRSSIREFFQVGSLGSGLFFRRFSGFWETVGSFSYALLFLDRIFRGHSCGCLLRDFRH